MDLLFTWIWSSIFLTLLSSRGASSATFTFVNNCEYTIWPGILANSGTPKLETTGFELPKGSSRVLEAPTGWSGRFWGRTSCNFGEGGSVCATGDCGSGEVECNGAGASPPATLAEFTLGSGGSQDFYDVSLVDGYNLGMVVEGRGGLGTCVTTGCVTDLNRQCPVELKTGEGQGCKSACEAFGSPEYCCSGEYNTPTTCKPSVYSAMFKTACPRSYSYAYDDATSTFTCMGADYVVTFCPSYPAPAANSQKSSSTTTPTPTDETARTTGGGTETQPTTTNVVGTDTGTNTGTGSSSTEGGGVMLADASWIAGLATGQSTSLSKSTLFISASTVATTVLIFVLKL